MEKLAKRVVKSLENEANQIDLTELWLRFDPLAKILVLDEGHGEANQMLNQIGGMVRSLEQEVQAIAQDRNGLGIQVVKDSKSLMPS